MDRLVRARVLLAEAEALGLTVDDLVAAVGRVAPADVVGADPGRVRGDGGAVVQRGHRRHVPVLLAAGGGPLRGSAGRRDRRGRLRGGPGRRGASGAATPAGQRRAFVAGELHRRAAGAVRPGRAGRARHQEPGHGSWTSPAGGRAGAGPWTTPSWRRPSTPCARRARTRTSTCCWSGSTSSPAPAARARSTSGSVTSTRAGPRSCCRRSSASSGSNRFPRPCSAALDAHARSRGAARRPGPGVPDQAGPPDHPPAVQHAVRPCPGGAAVDGTHTGHGPRPAPHRRHRHRADRRLLGRRGLPRPRPSIGHRHLLRGHASTRWPPRWPHSPANPTRSPQRSGGAR